MGNEWSIRNREHEWRLQENGTMLERGMSWELACPEGHRLRVYTNFGSLPPPVGVGCAQCQRPYPAKFSSSH